MKSAFRVVGGLDFDARQDRDEKLNRAEDRKRAAPLHREWLRRIEHHCMAGYLLPIDVMVAREMLNYPSANRGRCYAGRKRIADTIGANMRTVARSIDRLEACGLLKSQRGGQGKSATRFFCCNHLYVFGGKAFLPLEVSRLDGTQVSRLDGTQVSHKPSEQYQPPEQSLPLTPVAKRTGETILDGEILDPGMSFSEFWRASGTQGPEGFARAEWRKLDRDAVAAIADWFAGGRRFKRRMWSGTWLRDRVWLEFEQSESQAKEPASTPSPPKYDYAPVGSEMWRNERERRRASGDVRGVKQMDADACDNRGVTVRLAE